jgi:hypothetical protein
VTYCDGVGQTYAIGAGLFGGSPFFLSWRRERGKIRACSHPAYNRVVPRVSNIDPARNSLTY